MRTSCCSTLTNANLAGRWSRGDASELLCGTTRSGFTREQLYSTASYQQRNLRGIGLSFNDLTGWDFSGQDLTGADFYLLDADECQFFFCRSAGGPDAVRANSVGPQYHSGIWGDQRS